MDQMAVLYHGKRIKAYISTLEKDFSNEIKVEWVNLSSKEDILHWLSQNTIRFSAIIVEYFGEEIDSSLPTMRTPILLAANFQELGDDEWGLRQICSKSKKLHGVIDTARDIQFFYPLIRSSIQLGRTLLEMANLSETGMKMSHIMSMALGELTRVKKLHERLVPLRNETFKGLKVFSKFAAGESSGGEFFDIFTTDQKINLLLSSATSYVASSVILSHFENLRKNPNIDKSTLETFLEELTCELRELELIDRDRPEMLELTIAQIDLRTMVCSGFFFGRQEIMTTKEVVVASNQYPLNENFFDTSYQEFKLNRNEKYIVYSPGVKKNTEGKINNLTYRDFLKSLEDKSSKEILNEAFFQFKKNSAKDFLKYDATVICLEVDPNAIVQV